MLKSPGALETFVFNWLISGQSGFFKIIRGRKPV
jgi:hypothetical protein